MDRSMYLLVIGHRNASKNKLQEAVKQHLLASDRLVVARKDFAIEVLSKLKSEIHQLCAASPKSSPVTLSWHETDNRIGGQDLHFYVSGLITGAFYQGEV